MKTILAIINDPKESKDFIRYVATMAIYAKANVQLLFVQNPNYYPMGTTGATGVTVIQAQQISEAIANAAKKILEEHIEDVKSRLSENVVIGYATEYGLISLIIQELVSDNKAHMVVLEGQKDHSFWKQTSSNMEIVVDVECPVWIVPHASVYKPFNKIIYATDFNEEDIKGLKRLIALTHHFSPDITALHITDSIDFEEKVKKAGFLKLLQNSTAYNQLSVQVLNENKNNDIVERLCDFALHINADLIVVLKENKSFFERIFTSDTTKKIIKQSMLPVLVLHADT